MSHTRIHNLSISLDGFATGEPQSPMHRSAMRATSARVDVRYPVLGRGRNAGVDDAFAVRHSYGIGAEIMGARKFGPPGWQDDPDWKGWWGPNPPFHTPTFVLTHRPTALDRDGGAAPRSISSTPPRPRRSRLPAKRPTARTSGSAAAPPSCATSSPPGWSTTCTWSRSRSCSAAASRIWDGLEALEDTYDVEAVSSPSGVTPSFTRKVIS